MGIRIDLPWQKIANESFATSQAIDQRAIRQTQGPHCAIGEITYPKIRGLHKGILIYIKASLTGDENDYIFDYKKRTAISRTRRRSISGSPRSNSRPIGRSAFMPRTGFSPATTNLRFSILTRDCLQNVLS